MQLMPSTGCLYSISSGYLTKILDLILTALTALSLPHSAAPVEDLSLSIEQDHEVKREVVIQVMSWFGTISDDLWTMNVDAVLTQVGLGVLCTYQVRDSAMLDSFAF
jgi:sister chromatid cohesion protein DCC1